MAVTLRAMTYNIWQGGRHPEALGDVVHAIRPDVVVVNECPKTPLLWRGRCERLARHWGMNLVAGGRTAGSNLLLASPALEVRTTGAQVLPQPAFAPRRGVVWAQFRVAGGGLFGVVGCHLSLNTERRADEAMEIAAIARALRGPVILGGDLNERPGGPAWDRLARAGFVDHGDDSWLTFPADHPIKRIDALLVRGAVRVLRHGDPGVPAGLLERASDHRPVLAEVDL